MVPAQEIRVFSGRLNPIVGLICIALLSIPTATKRANAQPTDYWLGLSTSDLLGEARAAFHLGYLDPEIVPDANPLPSSLELLDRLLNRPDLDPPSYIKAIRLKLKIYDARGRADLWTQTFSNLPKHLNGFSDEEWQRQQGVWELTHLDATFQWEIHFIRLEQFDADPPLTGEAAADFEWTSARASLREIPGSKQGYFDLAEAIANFSEFEIEDPFFDPFYAQEDISHMRRWSLAKDVLPILAQDDSPQRVGLRRWFETVSPSVLNPVRQPHGNLRLH